MPTIIGGRVSFLDQKEKELIEGLVGESINPKTVDEFNAWVDLAAENQDADEADTLLLRAVVSCLRVNDAQCPDARWKPGERDEPAKVIAGNFKKVGANNESERTK